MTGWGSCWVQPGWDPLATPSQLLPPRSRGEVPRAAKAPGRAMDLTPPAAEL